MGVTYPDTTNYMPKNTVDDILVPGRWQPLCVLTAVGVAAGVPAVPSRNECTSPNYAKQSAYTPHWGNVKAFALDAQHQYTLTGPPKLADGSYDLKDVATALKDTANLDDTKKVTAEYWADGPASEFPPGHWALLGQAYSRKRAHSVDTDVKMFFTMGNALLDASISSWKAKYDHDFWRPTSAIRNLYAGKNHLLARPSRATARSTAASGGPTRTPLSSPRRSPSTPPGTRPSAAPPASPSPPSPAATPSTGR